MEYINSLTYVLAFMLIYNISAIMKANNIILSGMKPVLIKLPESVQIFVVSSLCGVLPVPGRMMVTSSCLSCMLTETNNRTGSVAYLSSHHYYLWSPLEKTVIIPIAVLGITYIEYMKYMWVPLGILMLYTYILTRYVPNIQDLDKIKYNLSSCIDMIVLVCCLILTGLRDSIQISNLSIPVLVLTSTGYLSYLCIKYSEGLSIKYPIRDALWIGFFIICGVYIKSHAEFFKEIVSSQSLVCSLVASFIISFLMGSSSKFVGLCVITTSVFGMQYFVLFFLVDFAGYILSPIHKCLPIVIAHFKAPVLSMYRDLVIICVILILYGVFSSTL